MSYLPGKFVWFEHVSGDVNKARAFYEPLFHWHIEAVAMGGGTYHVVMCGEQQIGGFRSAEAGVPSHWHSYLSVADVDASHAAALRAGASSLQPPMDIPQVGRMATLADPTGAAFSIWKDAQGDRADVETTPVGDWYWNELWTPDVQRALAFYEGVFGYTHEAMDMGAQGQYYLLKSPDGKLRAGAMQASEAGAPPMWQPYVRVDDCDASVAQAQQLGARQLLVPPTDILGVGRFAILLDSQGACIAVIKPLPQGD